MTWGRLIILLVAVNGCFSGVGRDGDSNRIDPIKAAKHWLSEARGLPFTAEVPILFETRETLSERLEAELQADLAGKKQEDLSLAYAKLGLLPAGVDLRSRLLNYYSSQAQGFYNSTTKKIVLLEGQKTRMLSNSPSGEEMDTRVLVHELTHALQDQHFSLAAKLRPSSNGDQVLALRAVAEADALLAEYAYLFGGLEEWVPDYVRQLIKSDTTQSAFSAVPSVIADKMQFQYLAGVKFVSRFIGNNGWLPVNRIYSNPPLSTEQILHPEKYFGMPDPPTHMNLGNLTALFSVEWNEIENDTLGELMVQCLLKQFLDPRDAAVAASGWDGDRFIAYRRGDDVAFVWATIWDSSEDAREFFDGYQAIATIKYHSRPLERDHFYIEKRDRTVLIVEGLPREYVKGLVENVWRGMETEEVKFQPPPLNSLTSIR